MRNTRIARNPWAIRARFKEAVVAHISVRETIDRLAMRSEFEKPPLLLTVKETAEILRTTDRAIYAMVECSQLPGVTRLGRRVLIRSEDLLRWLDQSRAIA